MDFGKAVEKTIDVAKVAIPALLVGAFVVTLVSSMLKK